MAKNVGFIGLGVMGRRVALEPHQGRLSLPGYGRRPETMAPLVEAGATACGSPEEAASGCDVIFTMVTNTQDVLEVVLGERGIVAGARPGTLLVDMGTISPPPPARSPRGSRRPAWRPSMPPFRAGESGP